MAGQRGKPRYLLPPHWLYQYHPGIYLAENCKAYAKTVSDTSCLIHPGIYLTENCKAYAKTVSDTSCLIHGTTPGSTPQKL